MPAVFTHDNAELLGGRQDVVTTMNSIEATVSQATTFVTMGVTDRFDVSVAVPVVSNASRSSPTRRIQRIGHDQRADALLPAGERRGRRTSASSRRSASATGLGDITVRLKHALRKRASSQLALGLDVRLPTGDEMNLLGTGATGLQPFVVWSATYQKVSPHVNAELPLERVERAGRQPGDRRVAAFSRSVSYALGADVSVNPRLTVAFDVLGRYLIDAERLRPETFHALDGQSTFPNIVFERDSFNALSGSIGVKVNVLDRLLVDVNLLFTLDEHGLRDKVTPLIGFEYSF